jgi:LPXTG-site transpeptidase (sortase) family protein
MKAFLVSVAVVVAACSPTSVEPATTSTSTASTSTLSTTSVPTADPSTTPDTSTTTDRPSPYAGLVEPIGSAIYDPDAAAEEGPNPVGLTIDTVDVVEAPVVPVGVLDNGEMEIPGRSEVGWYRYGPRPGDQGSAVLAAHIAFDNQPGVFRKLASIELGDLVAVSFDDGTVEAFQVIELAQYDKDDLPFDRVFSKDGEPILTLITCGGEFNRSLGSYNDNIVAYAIPVS